MLLRRCMSGASARVTALTAHLNTLQSQLRSKSIDSAMLTLQAIHEMKVVIPLTYFTDTIDQLAFQRDSTRTELLIRLASANSSLMAPCAADLGTKSRPVHLPLNKLMSYAVSALIRSGVYDEAFQLWLRVTNDGYLTNRASIVQLLQRVSVTSAAPPEEFIDRVHLMMRENLWHLSSHYYSLILCILRQHLTFASSEEAYVRGYARYVSLVEESKCLVDEPSLELLVVRLQCLCAMVISVKSRSSDSSPIASIQSECLTRAKRLYLDEICPLLHSLSTRTLVDSTAPSSASPGSSVDELIREMGGRGGSGSAMEGVVKPSFPHVSTPSTMHDDFKRDSSRLSHATAQLLVELSTSSDAEGVELILRGYLLSGGVRVGKATVRAWLADTLAQTVRAYRPPEQGFEEGILSFVSALTGVAAQWHAGGTGATTFDESSLADSLLIAAVQSIPPQSHWRTALQRAASLVGSGSSSQLSAKPEFAYSVVRLLSKYWDSGAVLHAFDLLVRQDAPIAAQDIEAFQAVLSKAIDVLDARALKPVVRTLDRRLDHVSQKLLTAAFQRCRVLAYCKALDGVRALRLLGRLCDTREGGTREGGSHQRVPLSLFRNVIQALYLFEPQDATDREVVANADATSRYVSGLMAGQGVALTPFLASLLLNLYSKAARAADGSRREHVFAQAEAFAQGVEARSSGAGKESVRSGLIKMYCVAGEVNRALAVLERSKSEGVALTALSFEPIVYRYAVVERQLVRAEDVLVSMLNSAIEPSTSIVDAFVRGAAYARDVKGALDKAQDLFNQHDVRPSADCMLSLLQTNLDLGDVYEGRRVVGVMRALRMVRWGEGDEEGGGGSDAGGAFVSRERVEGMFRRHGQSLL